MFADPLILMAAALALDAVIGDPPALYNRFPHPVTWIGALIGFLDRAFNRPERSPVVAIALGAISLAMVLAVSGAAGWGVARVLEGTALGFAVTALLASTLLAQRSLHDHVAAVLRPLRAGDIEGARETVSMIVGRDVRSLDAYGISRAAMESLAENFSDGVVAPLFWGCLLGLPGIVLYKAVNTADSMIGHRSPRYLYFGRAAARLDDVVNLIPARLTGLLIALATLSPAAVRVMARDARRHRSPNGGWPEAALAGALGVSLSGPRSYHGQRTEEPWLNEAGAPPDAASLARALSAMRRVSLLLLAIMGAIVALR